MTKKSEPWKLHRGFSDWGMFCQHDIYVGEEGDERGLIASVPSMTPYCMGAPSRDREYARQQWEYAKLIAQANNLKEIAEEFLDRMMRFGDWDDGCFYYNKTSASELQGLIEKSRIVLEKLSE